MIGFGALFFCYNDTNFLPLSSPFLLVARRRKQKTFSSLTSSPSRFSIQVEIGPLSTRPRPFPELEKFLSQPSAAWTGESRFKIRL